MNTSKPRFHSGGLEGDSRECSAADRGKDYKGENKVIPEE